MTLEIFPGEWSGREVRVVGGRVAELCERGATPQRMGRCGGRVLGEGSAFCAAPHTLGCGGTRLGKDRNGSLTDAQKPVTTH